MWKTAFQNFSRYITSNFLKAVFHKFYLVHFEYLDSCVLLEAIAENISWKCFVNAEHKSLISLLESCYELSFGRYCYNHGDWKWSWAARLINLAIHASQQAFTWSKSSIEKRQEMFKFNNKSTSYWHRSGGFVIFEYISHISIVDVNHVFISRVYLFQTW